MDAQLLGHDPGPYVGLYPFFIVDFVLSIVADTLILPFTIPQQIKHSRAKGFIKAVEDGDQSLAKPQLGVKINRSPRLVRNSSLITRVCQHT